MRGVFDEREAERSRKRRGREGLDEEKPDREVTLGSFTLLAILFGLVMLCGLSFGLGYVVGRREPAASSTELDPKPIAAQGDSAKGKPSGGSGGGSGSLSGPAAEAQSPEGAEASGQPGASDAGDTGGEAVAAASNATQKGAQSGLSGDPVRQVVSAVSDLNKSSQSAAKAPQQTQSKLVQPSQATAVQPGVGSEAKKGQTAAPLALMVQIAILAHQEDADVLVDALRRRGYAVAAHRDLADGMVHVRIGPFWSQEVANQWRQRLLNDGYNAEVQ